MYTSYYNALIRSSETTAVLFVPGGEESHSNSDDNAMPDIEANARKLTIDGSAAAPFFNLQSPLGADALKMPTLVSTRCSTCPSCHV